MHLLVIEDERALCETIVRSLRRLAYSVDCCYDGEKALELIGVEKYDLILLDLKMMNGAGHRGLTGRDNSNILEMAQWLSDHGKEMWIRHVCVPGLTDSKKELTEMRQFLDRLQTVTRVELLPYHTMGKMEWEKLGLSYPLNGVPIPTEENMINYQKILNI